MNLKFERRWALLLVCAILSFSLRAATAAETKTRNVFLIITDGFRWQEVFHGASAELMTKDAGGVKDPDALRKEFWRDSVEARREALLPFFWKEIAKHGQVLGNRDKGSKIAVANPLKFSYPGYNEILSGIADPRIKSNDKLPNPNVTVFEWLNGREAFKGRVAVFGTWDVFPYIFNVERSKLPIWPGWETKFDSLQIAPPQYVADLVRDTTPMWEDLTYDSFLIHSTLAYLKTKQPRLAFVGFGETDEWAHARRYDHYLVAAHHVDEFIRRLWEAAQSLPQYRDQTTIVVTADHGRGPGTSDWTSHGEKVVGAEEDWLAVLGPDTPALGEAPNSGSYTHSQIAATIAALLGEDFHAAVPKSGEPIRQLLPSGAGKEAK